MLCNGLHIHYEVKGQGAPVVLIHGLVATSKIWQEQVKVLTATHKVITYDLRGHGESAKPADGSFSFESHVADLAALLDGLGIGQASLVGWSMGVSVAVAFAATHPDRVSRLVLIDGTPMLVAAPDFPYAMPPEQQAGLVLAAQQDFNGLMKQTAQMMFPEPHDSELDDWLRGMARQAGAEVYIAIMRQAAPHDLRPQIAAVTVPTLVLHGERDQVCPVPAGQYFAEHIPGAAFHVIQGAGHGPFLTCVVQVNALLVQFLG